MAPNQEMHMRQPLLHPVGNAGLERVIARRSVRLCSPFLAPLFA
jgi:hypothetical protein